MDAQNTIPSSSKSPAKQKVTCRGCGKRVQLLLSHLERTTKPCKALYDMEVLHAEAARLHKEQMATRNRERYHSDPKESPKKRAASKEYYDNHTPEKKGAMSVYNQTHKEDIILASQKRRCKSTCTERYECPWCEKVFPSEPKMKHHFEYIHTKPDTRLKCPICDKGIKYKDNLDRHMREVHGEEKKYKCSDCSAAYTRKEHLEQHIRTGKHYMDTYCEHCKETKVFRYVAEKERHFINIKCDHSFVYATTCQSIIDERIKKANMQDKCFIPPNHPKKVAAQQSYYERNKKDEEKKSASKRLYCDHPEKEAEIKAISDTTEIIQTECRCEIHRKITCCSHHKLSHYTYKGYLDCHPFGATCLPGCDDCVKCITPLEGYKKSLGIEYENKFGCKKVGDYDFANHDDIERQKFWMRKSDPRASGKETYEWDGEEWKCMDGYYDCLFCKRKVGCTTKEKHLVHNKKGILTCLSMKKKNEGPFTPCRHLLCQKCGGKTEKDPWEERLWKSAFNCNCEEWIKIHPESKELPKSRK